jgi:hypothetical protein
MSDDASRLTDINAHPTYQASLRLACGATVRVTVLTDGRRPVVSEASGRWAVIAATASPRFVR